jgi:ferric-dicitrate binding protein FerR (iron transport regulator)
VNKDDQYWEKIICRWDTASSYPKEKIPDNNDYTESLIIKDKLEQIFLFDLFDLKQAKKNFNEKVLEKIKIQKRKLLHTLFMRAAVVLIAILSGFFIHLITADRMHEYKYAEIRVPLGQMTLVRLPDGTEAWLNSGTKFKYPEPFEDASREVFLDGEAYFSVTHNKKCPFTVFANNFSLTVLGTSFNVDAYSSSSKASITLVEGSVLLNDNKGLWQKKLQPGQMATIDEANKKPQITNTNTDFYTSWREGKVVFKSETFEEIANKLERWYNVEIHFANPELKQLKFSGTFLKYKPIEQVFSSICIMNPSIDFKLEDRFAQKNKILIFSKKKPEANNQDL